MNKIRAARNNYRCTRCGKEFEYLSRIRNHCRSHNGEVDADTFEVIDRE